jgi:hypothetical protein
MPSVRQIVTTTTSNAGLESSLAKQSVTRYITFCLFSLANYKDFRLFPHFEIFVMAPNHLHFCLHLFSI